MFANRQVLNGAWPGAATVSAPKAALTAAGTTQAGALLVTNEYNEFGTVASGAGAVLPSEAQVDLTVGDTLTVTNLGTNALLVYPPVGGTINALSANADLSVAAGKTAIFTRTLTPLKWVAVLSG